MASSTGSALGQLGGTLLSFGQTRTAAKIAKGEAKVAARQTELGAVAREANRKERLAEAMASQMAGAGAKGIAAFEGSPLTILQADIEREERGTQRDKFATELQAYTQRAAGKIQSKQMMAKAYLQLGEGLQDAYKTYKTPGQ
jgi:hypothetical protein